MTAYLIRRVLFMIPTLFGIMLVSFVVIQFAPGGPVERVIAHLSGADTGATTRISGSPGGDFGSRQLPGAAPLDGASSQNRGAKGVSRDSVDKRDNECPVDKPPHERFLLMMRNYLVFDFGKSYFRDAK